MKSENRKTPFGELGAIMIFLCHLSHPFSFRQLGFEFLVLMIFLTSLSFLPFWGQPDWSFNLHRWLAFFFTVVVILVLDMCWLGVRYLSKRNKQHKDDKE